MAQAWGKNLFILLLIFCSLEGPRSFAAPTSDETWQLLGQTFSNILDRPAPTFSLPDLQGTHHDLAKQQGRWTLLVFWATWCGVCQQSLPSVEGLHQALPGLDIWGISLDQGNSVAVQSSVQQHGLSFLILQDTQGAAAQAYSASAIPVAFLISPQLKMVAAVAGGFDWHQPSVVQNLQKIIASKTLGPPPESLTLTRPTLPGKPLPLPELELSFTAPHTFTVHISWPDAALKYRIKVPRIELPPEIKIKNVAARPQENGLTYIYDLAIPKKSNLKDVFLGPVTMTFTDALGRSEQSSRHPGIKLQGTNEEIGHHPARIIISLIIIFAMALAGAIYGIKKKKQKQNMAVDPQEEALKAWLQEVDQIKVWQRQHDPAEYAAYLLELELRFAKMQEKNNSIDTREEEIRTLLNDVRYGGRSFTPAEIAYHEKILLNTLREEKNKNSPLDI